MLANLVGHSACDGLLCRTANVSGSQNADQLCDNGTNGWEDDLCHHTSVALVVCSTCISTMSINISSTYICTYLVLSPCVPHRNHAHRKPKKKNGFGDNGGVRFLIECASCRAFHSPPLHRNRSRRRRLEHKQKSKYR